MDVKFIADSLADLSSETINAGLVSVVDIPITAVKAGHKDISFSNLTPDDFMEVDRLVREEGYVTKTSMPVIYETEDEAEEGVLSVERLTRKLLAEDDVLYLAANSAISGTFENVSMMYGTLDPDEFSGHRAVCVDTQCASTGLALLITDLLLHYQTGKLETLRQAVDFIKSTRSSIAHVFTWGEFNYIKNSGKVRALPAFLGRLLDFHPLCSVEYIDDNNRPLTTISGKIRGMQKFLEKLADFVKETITDATGPIIVAHGNDLNFAKKVKTALMKALPAAKIIMDDNWRCGAAIQAHGGPTSIHINYYRDPQNNFTDTVRAFHHLP